MTDESKRQKVTHLTPLQHCLQRPEMYVGAITPCEHRLPVFESGVPAFLTVVVSPALVNLGLRVAFLLLRRLPSVRARVAPEGEVDAALGTLLLGRDGVQVVLLAVPPHHEQRAVEARDGDVHQLPRGVRALGPSRFALARERASAIRTVCPSK